MTGVSIKDVDNIMKEVRPKITEMSNHLVEEAHDTRVLTQ